MSGYPSAVILVVSNLTVGAVAWVASGSAGPTAGGAPGAVAPGRGIMAVATHAQSPSSGGTQRSVWEGVYTEEQAARGRAVYTDECSSCHGAGLEGADEAPALTGAAFTANWDGLSVGDLVERIRVSMPQDNPGKLTRQQNADVVAYILSANKFPAGKTELPPELPVLKQIAILASKP